MVVVIMMTVMMIMVMMVVVLLLGWLQVSEGLLRHFAENVEFESMFGSPMTNFPEVFEKLCRLSLEDEQVCQELIGMVWAKAATEAS